MASSEVAQGVEHWNNNSMVLSSKPTMSKTINKHEMVEIPTNLYNITSFRDMYGKSPKPENRVSSGPVVLTASRRTESPTADRAPDHFPGSDEKLGPEFPLSKSRTRCRRRRSPPTAT